MTGANGFIGSALVRRLLRDGVEVRAMCRNVQKGQSLANAGAETVPGDVQDPATLAGLAKGCDVVFHVAAVLGGAARTYHVNVLGTRNVWEEARQAGAGRFVHVSTIAIYGYEVDGDVDEAYPQRPSAYDFYQQSKQAGEALAWELSQEAGLPMVSVRPGMVYGPGSSFWSRQLYEVCRRVGQPLVDGGMGHAHPIFIDDLVDLLLTCATHAGAPGYAFHATPDPAPTWAEFMGYYARMAGAKRTVEVPIRWLLPLGVPVALISRLLGSPFDLAGTLHFWAHRATFKMTRAAERLDWRPRTSLAEGMAQTEPWLRTL